jgi:CheY-like chemotaxis protein
VKSAGENLGSTFIVSLPVSHVQSDDGSNRAKPEGAADPLDSIDLPMLNGVRVLIVDDEPDGQMLIARILEGRGAQPVCASNVMQALDLLARQPFDILLSDIGMPDLDGYELIRRVRALKGEAIAAIAVTAYVRPEDRQRALLAGYHMHLSKPIEAKELIAGVASLLRLRS